ncbi:MAG TPA: biotin/lipoyl-containing protein [Clostridia bacterium]|nr:biotin/lipoyl-containing protein [Clostridia bacterium]
MKYNVTLNGKTYEVEVEKTDAVITNITDAVAAAPPVAAPAPVAIPSPAAPAPAVAGTEVLSPMPGTILSVNVIVGQAVKAGDLLLILEAMKMENEIAAPGDGTVLQILIQKGSTVESDSPLVVIG